MLLSCLLDFKKARRTDHGNAFAFPSYLACIVAPITNGTGRKAAVILHLAT
jgi:hypothetical protein